MRILLTNDDGIHAPGIAAMHRALLTPDPLGEVLAVAPLTVQSATSHGITFHQPLMVRETRLNDHDAIAVDGRPADCTKLALTNLWPERFGQGDRPDLVISGMNAGANCGINVLYSGTVAAALEAAFLGVPSIAVSLHLDTARPDFDRAAAAARRIIDRLLTGGLPARHEALSINIPATEHLPEHPDVVVCPMNTHALVDRYERRTSPSGETYYWAAGHGLDFRGTDPGTDVHELFERRITVTPLGFDLTNRERLAFWKDRLS
ncbi:MAG: 5'/3'-nucleotidase SurE [Planctomycetota bacterium]|nr:MAG: 5'/3'-nucleotidase SurE [Planctomycetota bacterium]